jgi:hypothetical protein
MLLLLSYYFLNKVTVADSFYVLQRCESLLWPGTGIVAWLNKPDHCARFCFNASEMDWPPWSGWFHQATGMGQHACRPCTVGHRLVDCFGCGHVLPFLSWLLDGANGFSVRLHVPEANESSWQANSITIWLLRSLRSEIYSGSPAVACRLCHILFVLLSVA